MSTAARRAILAKPSDAEMWARQVESEIDRGAFISRAESEQTTLRECLDLYAKEVVPLKKVASRELSQIENIKRHPLADLFMASIRGADVAAYRDDRRKAVKPATVQRELAMVSHVFMTARREWRMENLSNPVEIVRKPKLPQGCERRLRPGERDATLNTSESQELA